MDLNTKLVSEIKPLLIDLRTDEEWANGYIEGAIHIPIDGLLADMSLLPSDKAAPIVVIYQSGHRGGMALVALHMLGYTTSATWAAVLAPGQLPSCRWLNRCVSLCSNSAAIWGVYKIQGGRNLTQPLTEAGSGIVWNNVAFQPNLGK